MAINLERFVKAKRFTEDHVLDDASDQILVKVATDSVAGKVALNAGTSLPGDATNCTDALTACGLNALLADATVGGNTVINGIKALIPAASSTVAGITRFATNAETVAGTVTDEAVHPQDMSYALQTGQNYPINLNTPATAAAFLNSSASPFAIGTALVVNYTTGTVEIATQTIRALTSGTARTADPSNASVCGTQNGLVVPAGTFFSGVSGQFDTNGGAGTAAGVAGSTTSTSAGTNIAILGRVYVNPDPAQQLSTNWAGYFDGNVAGGAYTTLSDATLKEDVQAIDPAKALQFRNGLRWVSYEMFTEQQVQIMDAEGNATGRYEVKRNSLGKKRGLIAQEVQALAASIGDFSDVVAVVGEYFTLDAQGYPVKDAQGNNIVNKRLGLDYDAVSFIVMCAEQSVLIPA